MRVLMIVGAVLVALAIGCENLPMGGKCYDYWGDELTYVIDANGVEWDIKKTTVDGESYCSIPREAKPYVFHGLQEVRHPNGLDIMVSHRHEDKWILSLLDTDWY